MRLSERIGYGLEHLLALEIERRGIEVARNERPTNDSIKSDISFSHLGRLYVVFVTHTRTQGMTNRKFYRTFEELAQRRTLDPSACCIEVSLVSDAVRVPSQYGLLYTELFDASFSVISADLEPAFISFITKIGEPVNLDRTRDSLSLLHEDIRRNIRNAVSQILKTRRRSIEALDEYWNLETRILPGITKYEFGRTESIKLGMKMLALMPFSLCSLKEIATGRGQLPRGTKTDLRYLTKTGICLEAIPSIRGPVLRFSSHIRIAADVCVKRNIQLEQNWYEKYLRSLGAVRLYDDITNADKVESRTSALMKSLEACSGPEELFRLFIADYRNDELRCDLIDLSLRSCGYSQNEISLAIQDDLRLRISHRNPIWFIISKSEDADEVVANIPKFLESASSIIWQRCKGKFPQVKWEDVYAERIKTFYSHRSVRTDEVLIDRAFPKPSRTGKARSSILPRIVGLPARYRMSVSASRILQSPVNDNTIFLIIISTPDPQHHKHKEFSGKLRAIRYNWSNGVVSPSHIEFVAVIDGTWTNEQVNMLARAGWSVFDWDSFFLEFDQS